MILLADYKNEQDAVRAFNEISKSALPEDAVVRVISPYTIEELADIDGDDQLSLSKAALLGAVVGGGSGYFLEWYLSVIDFPLDVGGRAIHSTLAFLPVTFECTILGAALSLVGALFVQLQLPQPHHPIFESHRYSLKDADRFFVTIEIESPRDADTVEAILRSSSPLSIDQLKGQTRGER